MTYSKPYDVRYVDMCIYIDQNIYENTYDSDKVYQYLYLLVYMLATKKRLCKNGDEYDRFSLFSATQLYLRLTNKLQFEFNDSGERKLPLVKGILNYINKKLDFLAIDFRNSEYYQYLVVEKEHFDPSYNFETLVSSNVDDLSLTEFSITLEDSSNISKAFLRTLPYNQDSVEWQNIYISTFLTLVNMLTPSSITQKRIDRANNSDGLSAKQLEQIIEDESEDAVILFHLDESYHDYVLLLVRQVKYVIGKDLSESLQTNVCNDYNLIRYSVQDYIRTEEEYDGEYTN